MRARYRPERQNQGDEGADGGGGVLQQLEADVAGRQPRCRDPRSHDGGDEQAGAEELGEQAPAERVVRPQSGVVALSGVSQHADATAAGVGRAARRRARRRTRSVVRS